MTMVRQLPTKFVQYPSQQEAFSFLEDVLDSTKGLGLLHGPAVAGKSELIEQIAQKMRERSAVAVVDGSRLKPVEFLTSLLTQFGYELDLNSVDELLNMLSVIAVQQARTREAPVLLLEHFNHMFPSALNVLCKLATLTVHKRFALRIILVGDRYFRRVIDSPSMLPVAIRLAGDFELKPLRPRESCVYLFAKLEANGIEDPGRLFSVDVCEALHATTGGWPRNLDKVADAVMAMDGQFPMRMEDLDQADIGALFSEYDKVPEDAVLPVIDDVVLTGAPKLIVSYNGSIVQEFVLDATRTLLGRSAMSDVVIDNQYVSKHHALLVRSEGAVLIVDLKSRNGTYVNSERIKSRVLRNNDIVSLGDYRIKMAFPAGYQQPVAPDFDTMDTSRMKNLADARRSKAATALHAIETRSK